jgi:cell division ATPase FtsA
MATRSQKLTSTGQRGREGAARSRTELPHAIPQEYSVDKNQGIRDPIGMIGTRLETEMHFVTIGASPAMISKSVEAPVITYASWCWSL